MKMNVTLIVIGIVFIVVGIVRMTIYGSESEPQENDYVGLSESVPMQQAAVSAPVAAEPRSAASTQAIAHAPVEPATQSQAASVSETKPAETDGERAKRVGNEFENFVANIFVNRDVYTVLEWNQGQTSTEGVYAEADKKPDFKIKQNFGKNGLTYWVECKYRTRFNRGAILVREYQLKRYREIQSHSHRKIFLAIGVGENPSSPDEIFIVPLDSISSEYISRSKIEQYKMQNPRADFAPWVQSYFVEKVFRASRNYK